MYNWKLINTNSEKEFWDSELLKLGGFNLYQTYSWGEHRREFGWEPYRWIAYDDAGKSQAMLQGLLKRKPFKIGALWVPGGPAGNIISLDNNFRNTIQNDTNIAHLYCRLLLNQESTIEKQSILLKNGWNPVSYKIRSGLSMELDLSNLDNLHAGLSKNWRHNLRRSSKKELSIKPWQSPDIDEIYSLYTSMQSIKGLDEQFSKSELNGIFKHLGDKIILLRCDNKQGELIAIRGCYYLGQFGWDLFAATSAEARKVYASYALFWSLMEACSNQGVKYYDLMGIDPVNNKGVYNFKKGTGATEIEYLGEWEWSSNRIIKWGANYAIKRNSEH